MGRHAEREQPDEMRRHVQSEIEKWKRVVETRKIELP